MVGHVASAVQSHILPTELGLMCLNLSKRLLEFVCVSGNKWHEVDGTE